MKRVVFSEDELKQIIYLYQEEQLSMREIGTRFNVSKTVISRVLKENQVKARQHPHKYYADYRKFATINTPEKAYWLGFIAADGCNYNRTTNASIIINLHQKDIGHLEKFKAFMNTNANISLKVQNKGFSNNTPMCSITLNSLEMSYDLIDKGIVPNKSLILKPPAIESEFFLPYILGYFDGDGSISKVAANGNYSFSIVGTKEILEWISKCLEVPFKLEKRNQDSLSNTYYIRCGGTNKVYNIMKKLYDSVNVHLDRKYEIYQTLETVVLNRNVK